MSYFRFRERAKQQGKIKLEPVSKQRALFNALPKWYRTMVRAGLFPIKDFNREHEAERRRGQIERGIIRLS